ncbi:MAG: DUF4838 domain-containing protein [Phycisphaera sp.]|nr:DUF4838 domain-containing protein [Phycisphaera sp.]
MRINQRNGLAVCLSAVLLGAVHGGALAADVTTALSRDKQAQLPVVIAEQASLETRKLAEEFAAYLGRMSGATFTVEVGDGSRGVVLGKASDFAKLPFNDAAFDDDPFHREAYVLRSHAQGLYLLGASDLAVSHAAWDLLHRLGYRQFFPGPTWEVIPPAHDLSIAIDVRETPDFYSRRIWYNWGLWGYNNEPYRQWCQRNRAVQGFRLNSGHAYGSILARNKAAFDAHPEYYALNDGKRRTTGGDIKFCISNPGLRQLVVDYAVATIKANPKLDSISMDPSDGGHWCECDACAQMGSVSDRALTLANDVARAINQLGLGEKYVGMYAYNVHSPPPSIDADPHVIISATTAFLRGGFTFDQILEGWQARGATMGVYDYLSVVAWDWNLPRNAKGGNLAAIQSSLPKFHRQGARFYDAESGDCWGPCGLGYYFASRVLWDVDEASRMDAIVDDFLTRAFGNASEPMREFYRLINQDRSRRPPADLVGRMYRQLDAARRATSDPAVHARLDDLILYTRYAELYYAHAAGKSPVEPVARHAYRMRQTMMVHSYGLWARLVSQKAALTDGHPWKNDTPFAPDEITQMLTDGIAHNTPVDPGFESVAFSSKLIPAAARLKLPSVAPGRFPASPQDHQRYYVWLEDGAGSLDIQVRVEKVWANRMPVIKLYSPLEVKVEPVAIDEDGKPDGTVRALKLVTPYAGMHRVETIDGGDHTFIDWPKGMPVTIESGIDTTGVTSHFRGAWTLYFYVPRGTKVVGGWASRIANWAPRISGRLLDGSGHEVADFGKMDEGWFSVPVPAGEDGKLWKFDNAQGQRLLMTVPPYLARSAEELMLPAEVVDADAR